MPSNLLYRQFEAGRPNQKWIADFIYIWTAEGLALRVGSDRPVLAPGGAGMTAQLVADALLMAVWRRGEPEP